MRSLIAALALILAILPAHGDQHAGQIQRVITSQLDALGADDLEAAFAHASPMIQGKFGTPETFGRMVREGYPMIWRPTSYQMQSLIEDDRGIVQPVVFQDGAGRLFEAFYEMQEVEGTWRINGVYLRALPGVGS